MSRMAKVGLGIA